MRTKVKKSITLDIETYEKFNRVVKEIRDRDQTLYFGLMSNLSTFVNFAVRDALNSIERNINK